MANTSSRALRLLSLLQNHRFWPGTELAERLGVSPRTLRRDVDRLRELGYPVTAHRGVDGGYQLASGAALPPLVLDDEEAVALTVSLRIATQGAAAQGATIHGTTGQDAVDHGIMAEAAARALAKVTQVMPARLRRRVEALAAMTESASWDAARAGQATGIDPDVLASAALACRDTERLHFAYGAASGERTERHVEPHRLVALDRHWYLVAYDLLRNDWRSFRLNRVIGVPRPTGARFRPGAARRRRRRVRPYERQHRPRDAAGPGGHRGSRRDGQGPYRSLGHDRGRRPRPLPGDDDARRPTRLAGDRSRRRRRGLPGNRLARADRARPRLGPPLHPGGPATRAGEPTISRFDTAMIEAAGWGA